MKNLNDDNIDTAWVEGSVSNGIGEALEYIFYESVFIEGFVSLNGYHKSTSLWKKMLE